MLFEEKHSFFFLMMILSNKKVVIYTFLTTHYWQKLVDHLMNLEQYEQKFVRLSRLELDKVNNLYRKAKDLFAYTKVTATHANSIPDAQKEDYATPVRPFLNYRNNGRSLL